MDVCERCGTALGEKREHCGICGREVLCPTCFESHGYGLGHTDQEIRASGWNIPLEERR